MVINYFMTDTIKTNLEYNRNTLNKIFIMIGRNLF